ncbi:MAG: outer membrane protein assembly factor BamA [Rhodospirillaceae bacterium]|nr:outer membrane protein assembly factor BamA [Rhodospirillaceae bacterium]
MTFPDCSEMLARRSHSHSAPPRANGLRTGSCRALAARAVAALLALCLAASAWAFDPFTVRDIRVEGVQRTEAGTIFSYLPIKVGERIDGEKAAAAVKALYATGFFRDVRIEAQGDVLIVTVQERPTISSLTFVGNKEFDTDTIKKALKEVGIAEGRIFDRSALDRAEQELKRQYITRGKYAARVETTVTPQDRNRVAINFNIVEGDTANIARINIVGNQTFTEKQLRSEISLSTPNWLSWYTKDDQYSKQKLQADLEALRSFYQNRGYLEFQIESTQVSISPDKDEVFVTINLNEGNKFTVSGVQIAGELVVSEAELRRLLAVKPGDTFSRSAMQVSVKNMSERLGIDGYAFANVNAVPDIDRAKNTVGFTFYVDAGRRVYVRKINIGGNPKTRDEVIRREFRQVEGAWYDGTRIERSKVRVRRLGYFEEGSVNIETPPVPGTTDQVDIELTVAEKNTGNLLAGVGYSSNEGVVFNASVSQQNIFGSGNALALAVNTSSINRTISLTYTEPYWTVDGVSRTLELYNKNIDPTGLSVAQFSSSTLGAAVGFGVPVSEIDTINYGFRVEHTSLSLFDNSPPVYFQFVQDFGYVTNSYIASAGWSRDTRNDILYPTFGRLQSALVEIGLPFGDLAYYKLQYINQSFWPVYDEFVLMLRADLGYGDGFSGKPFPFFKAFYAGGVGSVRGYETGSLGPRDIYGNTLGGKRRIVGNAELFYPILKGERSVRISGFFDAGQVYVNGFQPQFENFRYSAGVGLAWNSPIGPLKFSYATPISSIPEDRIQKFQFQVGSVF